MSGQPQGVQFTENAMNTSTLSHRDRELLWFSYSLFNPFEVTNVVSTRLGGVSAPPYHSLNLALSNADDPANVLENRRRLCDAVDVNFDHLTIGQLIQGLHIAVVTEENRGRGSLSREQALVDTDGLVTNLPDTPLMILVADCAVVSYFDPVKRVIALAHCGWRGTVGHMAKKMISVMQETYGSSPEDILVGISPAIGKESFQVRDDVLEIFRKSFPSQADTFFTAQEDGSYLLDLNAALLLQLQESGVTKEHIEQSGICTYKHTQLFYSHRAERGKTGRFAGLIALP